MTIFLNRMRKLMALIKSSMKKTILALIIVQASKALISHPNNWSFFTNIAFDIVTNFKKQNLKSD